MYNHTRHKWALVQPGIMPLSNSVQTYMILLVAYVISGDLPSVRVHAGEEMNSGGVDQLLHLSVPFQVRLADMMGEVEEEFSPEHLMTRDQRTSHPPDSSHLVAVHIGDVLHLRLHQLVVAGLVGELQDVERDPLGRGL